LLACLVAAIVFVNLPIWRSTGEQPAGCEAPPAAPSAKSLRVEALDKVCSAVDQQGLYNEQIIYQVQGIDVYVGTSWHQLPLVLPSRAGRCPLQ
jgi:hypothetical protein